MSSMRYSAFIVYALGMVEREHQGTVSGSGEMAGGFSFALMAFVGGKLITVWGYTSLFLLTASITAIGGFLFWAYFRKPRGLLAKNTLDNALLELYFQKPSKYDQV